MRALFSRIHGWLAECGRKERRNFRECFNFHAFRAITVCSILGVRRSVRTERLLVGYKKKKKLKKKKKTQRRRRDSVTLTHTRVQCAVRQVESSSSTRYSSQTFSNLISRTDFISFFKTSFESLSVSSVSILKRFKTKKKYIKK